jgi:hypothetical protein
MSTADQSTPRSMLWTGRILSALIVLFMLFDGVAKLAKVPQVVEGTVKYGYPESSIRWMGLAAVVGATLYAVPQSAVLGAIVLTAYFGGAVATHVRAAESSFWFAVGFGVITWLGIYLRDARLRQLVPLRKI